MKVRFSARNVLLFFRDNTANIVTFIGFILTFEIIVLLWEMVSIFAKTGVTSWSTEKSWAVIILTILAALTDLADGAIARSNWGKVTGFGRNADKLRDKLLVEAILINMARCLYALLGMTSSVIYAIVSINVALAILAIAFDLILLGIGLAAIVFNYLSKNHKLPESPTKWGKRKMALACITGIFWELVFLAPYPLNLYISLDSYIFTIPLFFLLLATNILAAKSIHGYVTRINGV
jgi:phosphatidylglycerophosphate synthase